MKMLLLPMLCLPLAGCETMGWIAEGLVAANPSAYASSYPAAGRLKSTSSVTAQSSCPKFNPVIINGICYASQHCYSVEHSGSYDFCCAAATDPCEKINKNGVSSGVK